MHFFERLKCTPCTGWQLCGWQLFHAPKFLRHEVVPRRLIMRPSQMFLGHAEWSFWVPERRLYATSNYTLQFIGRRVFVLRRCFWFSRNASISFHSNVSRFYPPDLQPEVIWRLMNNVATSLIPVPWFARKITTTERFLFRNCSTYSRPLPFLAIVNSKDNVESTRFPLK